MRPLAPIRPARLALFAPVAALLALGPIGCGSSSPPAGALAQVSPETVKANGNMQAFMKTQKKGRTLRTR